MPDLQKNQLHTVTITGYTAEGLGVARIDGQVIFIHNAVRGEVCAVHILKVQKNVAYARVEDVLERSSARREPDCPHYPACGGCDRRRTGRPDVSDQLLLAGQAVPIDHQADQRLPVPVGADIDMPQQRWASFLIVIPEIPTWFWERAIGRSGERTL